MKAKLEIYSETGDVLETIECSAWFTWAEPETDLLVSLSGVVLDGDNGVQLTIPLKVILEELKVKR